MKLLKVEVADALYELIKHGAAAAKTSEEKFIAAILSRYAVDPHIMDSKAVADGYVACGQINLELSK